MTVNELMRELRDAIDAGCGDCPVYIDDDFSEVDDLSSVEHNEDHVTLKMNR